jgi:hypothetical protein
MQDTDELAARDERHPEHDLDALFPQDRIADCRLVDPVEGHWSPLGGDPAGKTHAHRDPHPLADFLLHTPGRPGHQLAGILVEQQDGRGVAGQDTQDPLQQDGH